MKRRKPSLAQLENVFAAGTGTSRTTDQAFSSTRQTLFITQNNYYNQGRAGHRENRDNSRWPGSQFGPLPYFLLFLLLLLLFLPAECILNWLFPNSPFNNKTPINHESASLLGWQRNSPRARSAHPRIRASARRMRDSSRSAQVEQRGKTVLFMTSSAGQLHL